MTLTCLVEQGGPADVIDWYKDDQPISSRVYSNSSRWTEISLINITREDAGKYECTVRKRDEKDTDIIQLHVNGISKQNFQNIPIGHFRDAASLCFITTPSAKHFL